MYGLSVATVIVLLSVAQTSRAAVINVIDVIPNSDSSEAFQNSEPSLGVNPLNPLQMIAGSFGNGTPYFKSVDGGTIWSDYGALSTNDKSIAWRQDGVAALTSTLQVLTTNPNGSLKTSQIQTFSGTIGASSFGTAINTLNPGQALDQPWIRTGPSGQTYEVYNNLSNTGGRSATMRVSSDNGATFASPVTLETVNPVGGQDAPSVRSAVSGSTVYAVFTRWGTFSSVTGGDIFSNSQVVVVKSTNSGASFSAGTTAATTTGYFSTTNNTPLTLGQQRTSSDVAIAVDPNTANHVLVAYGDRTGAGLLQLKVVESTDGGTTWTQKFTTSSAMRSALPALSIAANGTIGLLYASYDPNTNQFSQHLLTTSNDFATTDDSLLGTETNATPTIQFNPYIGDFYDLTSVDDVFYGIFSASNFDNGNPLTGALFPDVTFQRDFMGTPGTPSFELLNLAGNPVGFSIDPFFFSFDVPEPSTIVLLGTMLLGLAALRRRRL